jgi:hypothetical protein
VLGVPVPVMQIVEVIIVWDALMATVGTVDVLMLLVLAMIGSGSHPMLHPRAQQRRAHASAAPASTTSSSRAAAHR